MGIVSRSSSYPVIGVVLPLAVTCTLLQALLQYVFIVLQYIVWFERHFSIMGGATGGCEGDNVPPLLGPAGYRGVQGAVQ